MNATTVVAYLRLAALRSEAHAADDLGDIRETDHVAWRLLALLASRAADETRGWDGIDVEGPEWAHKTPAIEAVDAAVADAVAPRPAPDTGRAEAYAVKTARSAAFAAAYPAAKAAASEQTGYAAKLAAARSAADAALARVAGVST